ncbi:MAG TPA: hypothetical protein VMV72_00120 [Verrucomicrobiae bacterium]|nr:hypothetical protein [Verrucomicrobiae bacterium]
MRPLEPMFVYRPPKGSCWGHSIGKDPVKAKLKLDAFFDAYFERVESQGPTTLVLAWKSSVLPEVEWPEAFLGPEKQKVRQFLFMVMGDRVMFPMGIVFPLSTIEPASFEFLGRFGADAPFKMSAKHFQIGIVGKTGSFAWRKPDADIAAKLEQFIV